MSIYSIENNLWEWIWLYSKGMPHLVFNNALNLWGLIKESICLCKNCRWRSNNVPECVQGYLRLEASEFITDGIVYVPILASLIWSQDRIIRVLQKNKYFKIIVLLDFFFFSLCVWWMIVASSYSGQKKKYLDTLKCSLNVLALVTEILTLWCCSHGSQKWSILFFLQLNECTIS